MQCFIFTFGLLFMQLLKKATTIECCFGYIAPSDEFDLLQRASDRDFHDFIGLRCAEKELFLLLVYEKKLNPRATPVFTQGNNLNNFGRETQGYKKQPTEKYVTPLFLKSIHARSTDTSLEYLKPGRQKTEALISMSEYSEQTSSKEQQAHLSEQKHKYKKHTSSFTSPILMAERDYSDYHLYSGRGLIVSVTSMTVLSAVNLLLADYHRRTLGICDLTDHSYDVLLSNKLIYDFKGLLDTALLTGDRVAVLHLPTRFGSTEFQQSILIFYLYHDTKPVKTIRVTEIYRCITSYQDHLFAASPKTCQAVVDKLDLRGDIKKRLRLDVPGDFLTSIAVSKDGKKLFVCGYMQDTVASLTMDGEVIATYHDKDMKGPRCLVELDDGSLLVTCSWSGSIHFVSSDMKQGCTVASNLPGVWTISYQPLRKEVYLGSLAWKGVKVFALKLHSVYEAKLTEKQTEAELSKIRLAAETDLPQPLHKMNKDGDWNTESWLKTKALYSETPLNRTPLKPKSSEN